ncbi:MAG TPA: BadF/BadG/BcrA/BcrD ATPase family protein [Gemmatimonadales bacterium]|nr:BadF/BadG/BcrA/BcrD ATPase family protein [Gemmatimonadales bacterium]
MSPVLIGADVGGTRTTVAVAEGDTILGRAIGSGAAVRPGRALPSATTIAEVVRRALAEAGRLTGDVLVVGAAGAGREPERTELHGALRSEGLAATIVVTTDIEIALDAAFSDGPGIVVSAGTGSIAVGRDPDGRVHRLGGYGWQMGDEGSGYAIGRAALGAVSRARDERSPATALQTRVLDAARCADFDALVRWAAAATPAEVASLAPDVIEVAASGDVVAQGIVDYAARELSQLALLLAEQVRGDATVPVVLTGGLLEAPTPLRGAVLRKLAIEPAIRLVPDPVDAVLGALRIARTRAG